MRTCLPLLLLVGLAGSPAPAQTGPDPGEAAYIALRAGDLDRAVALFRQAIAARPDAANLHKDFAYALLKTGEREQARDQFAAALRIDPNDELSALEYGFLCYETKKPVEAHRIFLRWKELGSQETRAKAAAAFESIDRPLREGIERWKAAVAAAPDQWTAHEELARLAEQHDELALAAEHYQTAWQLRPAERRLMIDLARVLKEQGKLRESMALLLAASRSPQPRVAEMARELMPARYPYPYEFEDALQADPDNPNLRREYAFLLLAMGRNTEAQRQLEIQVRQHPDDRLSREQLRVMNAPPKPPEQPAPGLVARPTGQPPQTISAREMGIKSYHLGYLQDALRYLQAAWEQNPGDAEVALQLGWTLNLLQRDDEALVWFDRARRSGGPETSREADRAYHSLRAGHQMVRLTVWALPMYSSRWGSMFLYSQAKLDFVKAKKWGFQPYISLRWVGDTKTCSMLVACTAGPGPMLSDSALIAAAGVNRYITPHLFVWGEAGRAFSYAGDHSTLLDYNPAAGSGQADYRGGASYLRGWGAAANDGESGWFTETGADAVYVSRYDHNSLLYTQFRGGYTLPDLPGGLRLQPLWNANWTVDARRQWWGNFMETGPGVRFRWAALPPKLSFRTDFLRGAYLVNPDGLHPRTYWDARASLWYAITR